MDELIARLEKIAKKNEDAFKYHINILVRRGGKLEYVFECIETADGHSFVSGIGDTIELAISDAIASIPEALEQWGYKE